MNVAMALRAALVMVVVFVVMVTVRSEYGFVIELQMSSFNMSAAYHVHEAMTLAVLAGGAYLAKCLLWKGSKW